MDEKLYISNAIEIRKSSTHGYGVFAARNIKEGEVVEECYYIKLATLTPDFHKFDEVLKDYVFSLKGTGLAVVLGYGMIYNDSENANINYEINFEKKLFIYSADKDILKDEELFIDYEGGCYAKERIRKELV